MQNIAQEIFDRYQQGEASDAEKELVEYWYEQQKLNKPELSEADLLAVQDELYQKLPIHEKPTTRLWPRFAAAAAVLVAFGISGYLFLNRHKESTQIVQRLKTEQILPKQSGITLTLANGQTIAIDQKHRGNLATGDGAVARQSDGSLNYEGQKESAPAMETLTNNSGGKFSLTLADGSEAFLDAQSSITYPIAFTGRERIVTISGQAYFKVRHISSQPFVVNVNKESVEDIGTEFNINAFEPAVKTTLIEGAVKINHSLLLHPGEQSVGTGRELKVIQADLEAVTAWMQGKMAFHHEPFEEIMRKVSRVYDVKVLWQDPELKNHTYGGSVSTSKKLSTVLDYFRRTKEVDFKVDGKTVTVFKPR